MAALHVTTLDVSQRKEYGPTLGQRGSDHGQHLGVGLDDYSGTECVAGVVRYVVYRFDTMPTPRTSSEWVCEHDRA